MIYYDYLWSQSELNLYRNDYRETERELTKYSCRDVIWLSQINDTTVNYPNPSVIIDGYDNQLHPLVSEQFNNRLKEGYVVDAKLASYSNKDHFGWHSDEKVSYGLSRLLSTITYLNDDFESGETEFINQKITPVSGKTLVFPSSFNYPHRGLSVTKGIKKILVMHIWVK